MNILNVSKATAPILCDGLTIDHSEYTGDPYIYVYGSYPQLLLLGQAGLSLTKENIRKGVSIGLPQRREVTVGAVGGGECSVVVAV